MNSGAEGGIVIGEGAVGASDRIAATTIGHGDRKLMCTRQPSCKSDRYG